VCKNQTKHCLKQTDYQKFLNLSLENYKNRHADLNFQRVAFLNSIEFLKNVTENPENFRIFSGHDITLDAILGGLGVKLDARIPFASRIVFEFWQFVDSEISFRVLYNGKHVFPISGFFTSDQFSNFLEMRFQELFPGAESVGMACDLEFSGQLFDQPVASTQLYTTQPGGFG